MITNLILLARNWKFMFSLVGLSTMLYFRELPTTYNLVPALQLQGAVMDTQEEQKPKEICHLIRHIWYQFCTIDLQTFCQHPFFPKLPDETALVTELNITGGSTNMQPFLERIFGFIRPPTSGRYDFAVSSSDSSEFWLSTDNNWSNSRRIAISDGIMAPAINKDFSKSFPTATIYLTAKKKYYIEILHWRKSKQKRVSKIQVLWKFPKSLFFKVIGNNDTAPLTFAEAKDNDNVTPPSSACLRVKTASKYFQKTLVKYSNASRFIGAYNHCKYKPSYIQKGRVNKNDGIFKLFRMTKAFPHHEFKGKETQTPRPQEPLDGNEAREIVALYMRHIERNVSNKYTVRKIENLERKADEAMQIDRILIELQILDKETNDTFHHSEYVLVDEKKRFCKPERFQWNKTAMVYFVVTAANQLNWVLHFIRNMMRIYQETQDRNIGVVIAVYDTKENHLLQIKDELDRSNLPHYEMVTLSGRYSRMKSFNAAVQVIANPHSIVFLVDLHLEIASAFVDEIRKHCIAGKSVYTPTIFRLGCGYVPANPAGFWETAGFGLVAMYKSDWDRIGGFDLHDNATMFKWGGEDWALMDKIVGGGLEYERVRCPYVYHYFHSKKGMW